MRKSTRRRPELELLETMLLLSTVSAKAHHAAKAAVPVPFQGTFPLTIQQSSADEGTVLTGQAKLAKFGRTQVEVSLAPPSSGVQSFVMLRNKHSMAGWDTQISLPANGGTVSLPYSIDQDEANGIFARENNTTGTLTLSNSAAADGESSYVLTLS